MLVILSSAYFKDAQAEIKLKLDIIIVTLYRGGRLIRLPTNEFHTNILQSITLEDEGVSSIFLLKRARLALSGHDIN